MTDYIFNLNNNLPLLIVLSALLPGIFIFAIKEDRRLARLLVNIGGTLLCLSLIVIMLVGVASGDVYETRLPLLPGVDLKLHADALSLLFVSLSGFLWLLTTIYAVGYLKGTKDRSRFFGFFNLCVGATIGIALAGNLITFLIFYELLTLTTYPLLVHKGNQASLRAGRIYLTYTLGGGALLLAGVVWLMAIAGPVDFTPTGILSGLPTLDSMHLVIIFWMLIIGLGVKAALVPLHGWLPIAMAAPAPVSALLHAVAVVKAGAFGIIRVVYEVYGIEFARELGVTMVLAVLAAFTIVYGSVRALFQNDLKRRLAYSTISQVSYIALGTAIAGPIATIGGMVHLVHQGLMKITMFFCAGNLAETLHIHKISEMDGVGRRMPVTMTAFTIAALGMIGLPPIAGFVSKWYLGIGAIETGAYWVLGVLAVSSFLNAAYFLPVIYRAWFKAPTQVWPESSDTLLRETHWMLLLPPAITAALAVLVGVFANASFSPLSWAKLIAAGEYGMTVYDVAQQADFTAPFLWLAVITPLVLACTLLMNPVRARCAVLTPWAAVPALGVALLSTQGATVLPWLFLGSTMALNDTTQVILLLAATLWIVAGLYGRDYLRDDANPVRYCFFYLLSMCGSFGLILAQDLFGFITFYTLMSLAAYGLVVHSGSEAARRAGRSYLVWVVIGEVVLFAAMVGMSLNAEGSMLQASWVSWLLLIGFGIKAGLLSLHFWLPLAHPVAPVPASALLSGLMVKAGVLGWWRFLPLGEQEMIQPGTVLVTLGLAGAFFAVVLGLMQKNVKALLAYSTISQMGILSGGVGVALMAPELWPALFPALMLYVVHHGLAKSALFLSVGLAPALQRARRWRGLIWLVFLLPALALAGAPFTSGAIAKFALKQSVAEFGWLILLLSLSAMATTVLMLRFVQLLKLSADAKLSAAATGKLSWSAYIFLVVAGLIALPLLPQAAPFLRYAYSAEALWNAAWPMAAGAVLFMVGKGLLQRYPAIESAAMRVASTMPTAINLKPLVGKLTWQAGGEQKFTKSLQDRAVGWSRSLQVTAEPLLRVSPGAIFVCVLFLLGVALLI